MSKHNINDNIHIFRACIKEAIVNILDISFFSLFFFEHILGSKEDKLFCPVSIGVCSMRLVCIYPGTIPFQYLKNGSY